MARSLRWCGVVVLMLLSGACADEPVSPPTARSTIPHSSPSDPVEESPSPTEAVEPPPSEEPEPSPRVRPFDEQAVLAMLQEYVSLYNAGDYIQATGFLTSDVERECGGPTDLAFALSQNHRIEQIDYEVTAVRAWKDDPSMADVDTVERYDGGSDRFTLGLAVAFERESWKLADLYPLGAGAFC